MPPSLSTVQFRLGRRAADLPRRPARHTLSGGRAILHRRAALDLRQHQLSGASPENLYNSVTRLIEEELNGANGILNFESTSDSLGQVEITANFVPGTDIRVGLGRGAEPHQARRGAPAARRHCSRAS